MKITCLRFFSVYGPFGRPDMAPWIFTNAILKGLPVVVYGDGLMQRDFTYIDDVVRSIHKVIEKEQSSNYEVYNIGCSSPQSVLKLIKTIECSLKKKAKILYSNKDNADVEVTFANMNKFCNDFENSNSIQFTSLDNGIKKFCFWFRNYMGNRVNIDS